MSARDRTTGKPGRALIRVLVVEDQQTLAGALQVAFGAQPDMDCVGAVGTAEEAVVTAAAASPDVVLMDIRLPGADGIEATRQVKAVCPQARVLILTADATPARLAAAAAAGASGFLAKDSPFPAILAAIRAPVDGKILIEQAAMTALVANLDRVSAPQDGLRPGQARLTARERQVLTLMGEGLDPQAIAARLVVSRHTARGHVKNILMKLGAHTQLEAVVIATRAGYLPRPSADPEPS